LIDSESKENDKTYVRACRFDDLEDGQVIGVRLLGREIAIYRVQGRVFATDNRCTHANVPLSEGRIIGALIQCPLHVAWFDIATGEGKGPPIVRSLKTYRAHIRGEYIEIGLSSEGGD